MSEAIIVRGGKSVQQTSVDLSAINNRIDDLWDRIDIIQNGTQIPVYQDRCTILVTVKDSSGQPLDDLSVHCNDGGKWYNYHTNNNGQCLFMTNNGQVNIVAWNFSLNGNYKYVDQNYADQNNIDAPVGTSKSINLSLPKISGEVSYTGMSSDIYNSYDHVLYSGNFRLRVTDNIQNLFIGGAGGGGWYCGGGGGGATFIQQYSISRNYNYSGYVGSGGGGGTGGALESSSSSSGGTTSIFGYMATGGGGGGPIYSFAGGSGGSGIGNYSGGNGAASDKVAEDSEYFNWGGGGGVGANNTSIRAGGNPYGGRGSWDNSYDYEYPTNGGGGGGMWGRYSGNWRGSPGGGGKISFIIP